MGEIVYSIEQWHTWQSGQIKHWKAQVLFKPSAIIIKNIYLLLIVKKRLKERKRGWKGLLNKQFIQKPLGWLCNKTLLEWEKGHK